jgi:cysteinyl-tRNA synthetase
MQFIKEIRDTARSINPGFLVVVQNAPYLIDENPAFYASIIDALATEDTWFFGEGDADWHSPNAGDLRGGERHADDYSTANRIIQNKKYLARGIPVFTVDYCISGQNAAFTYRASRQNGFIPLVTRVSLSEITQTPPF